jgi:hypothetical protein
VVLEYRFASGPLQGRGLQVGVWSSVDTRAQPYFIRSFCNGYVQHAESFIYGLVGDDAKLTVFEMVAGRFPRGCWLLYGGATLNTWIKMNVIKRA